MALLRTNTNSEAAGVSIAAKVFAENGDFIRRIIRYHINNEALADDLFQDFFLSLVAKPPPIDIQNIKGFLYKAITNDIIDAIRRIENYRSRIHRYAERDCHFVTNHRPENGLITEEEMNKMLQLIEGQLRQSEAKAIILRYRNGYKVKEVAEKMNVRSGTIRDYISDGLKKIRHFLEMR